MIDLLFDDIEFLQESASSALYYSLFGDQYPNPMQQYIKTPGNDYYTALSKIISSAPVEEDQPHVEY
jgi:hypothetical protein